VHRKESQHSMKSAPAAFKSSPMTRSAERRAAKPSGAAPPQAQPLVRGWRHTTLSVALLGSLLMWAALPPLDLWPLAWVAPVPWLLLVRREALAGRRPYMALWLAGFAFWLGAVHWLRLPHPATSVGWIALSFYLAFYLPAFVGLSRAAVHQLGMSVVVAAPIVWTGLELLRGHLLTGFSMGLLAHTQIRWPVMIQIADLGGAYAVSFVLMMVAASVARLWPRQGERRVVWPIATLLAAPAISLAYGYVALAGDDSRDGPTIALIQGSIDTEMKADPAAVARIHEQYFGLSQRAVREHSDLDLIVWPETMCRSFLITHDEKARVPKDAPITSAELRDYATLSRQRLQQMAQALGKRLLLGVDTIDYGPEGVERYNSALWVDPQAGVGERYDKVHRVMFGEYVPFAEYFPWLYRLTPLPSGIGVGSRLPAFELGGARLAANICFESAVPHLIRQQVARLRDRGQEPDILVNLTNDGWFWGSSELDMHLACGVFRAIELRKPFLIAANTGFSAYIDADGRIVQQGPRRDTGVIVEPIQLDRRRSLYSTTGDFFAGMCLTACLLLSGVGMRHRRRLKQAARDPNPET
jgi:apolipoprotein N-acyltransferase